jgi:hypothetical protein
MTARLTLALWLAVGCLGGDPLAPSGAPEVPGPERSLVQAPLPAPETSSVRIPLTIAASALRSQVTSKVPKVLLDVKDEQLDKGIVGDVYVERSGEPVVSTASGALTIDVPISMRVKPRPGIAKGSKLSVGTVHGAMTVKVRLRPRLNERWAIEPHAEVTHVWTTRPVLEIGPLAIDVSRKTDEKLGPRLAQVAADLDRDLANDLDLRSKIEAAWNRLALPQRIKDDPPTWLAFAPTALSASDPKMDADGVHVTIGAAGQLALVVGAEAPTVDRRPLPDRSSPVGGAGVRIAAPISLQWETLVPELRKQVEGQHMQTDLPTGGQAQATLTRLIDVYPSGTGLAIGVQVRVLAAGQTVDVTLWLTGTPELHGTELRITSFAYTAASDRAWLDTAHAALSGTVRDRIAERLVVPLDGRLTEVKDTVNAHLASSPPVDGVAVRGEVTQVALDGVHLTEQAMVVRASLEGTWTVTVTTLPPR